MALNISDDPQYWRKRAEDARALADGMTHVYTKSVMIDIATSYEKIAEWVEDRIHDPR
jgi:hypothetical protein